VTHQLMFLYHCEWYFVLWRVCRGVESMPRNGRVITKEPQPARPRRAGRSRSHPSAMQAAQQQELEAMTDMFNKCVLTPSLAARELCVRNSRPFAEPQPCVAAG
jgi:hypothetical protein